MSLVLREGWHGTQTSCRVGELMRAPEYQVKESGFLLAGPRPGGWLGGTAIFWVSHSTDIEDGEAQGTDYTESGCLYW